MPLNTPDSDTPPDVNLVKIENVQQRSEANNDRLTDTKFWEQREDKKGNGYDNCSNSSRNMLQTKPQAFRLSNGSIFVKPELLCNLGCETPRINSESCLGKEYRYFYAMSSDVDIEYPGTVTRFIFKIVIFFKLRRSNTMILFIEDYQSRYEN